MRNRIPGEPIKRKPAWISAPGYEEGKNFWRVSDKKAGKSVVVQAKTQQQACWVAADALGLDWKKAEARERMQAVKTTKPGTW